MGNKITKVANKSDDGHEQPTSLCKHISWSDGSVNNTRTEKKKKKLKSNYSLISRSGPQRFVLQVKSAKR